MDDVTLVLESASRLAVLLVFIAAGELLAERAGALNISVEGMALGGAYGAAWVSSLTESAILGLAGGISVGVLIAAVQAQLSHRITINQFVVGLAINLLVLGVTSFLAASVELQPERFGVLRIPVLADLPLVGEALFEQRWPFYAVYVVVPLVWWSLMRSRWGLELRAVGEEPEAAAMSGVPVQRRRRQAIYACGVCAGLGGSYLSIALIGNFTSNMTAGRGFIAIAAVMFGGWTVRGMVAGCLVFGGADALRLAVPAIGLELNPQLLISAPYLLALTAMLLLGAGRRQPLTLGRGYEPMEA